MKKFITVTPEILENLNPYQSQNKAMPAIGDVLEVHGDKIPMVNRNGYFVQVTNWRPSHNSLEMIRRMHEPDAEKYGWKKSAEITFQILMEKKQVSHFERWSIDIKFIK